jgi:glucose/arabinose dehydrogenase
VQVIKFKKMKNTFSSSLILTLILINISCAQDLKPLDGEPDNSILMEEINYEMELVFEDKNIIWAIEFLNDNSILAAVKSGSIIHFKNGEKIKIKGVPEIYLRGQGGLLDIELHPDFSENKWLYMSYAFEENKGEGGNTTIARARLIDDSLEDLEILYKGIPNTRKGQHYGSRMAFDNENYLYFSIGDRGNRNVNPQDIKIDGGKIYRIKDNGTIPSDNPFFDSPESRKAIFSYGHRNPQGMFKHPKTGKIWTNEHGPKGGDEINIIEKGKNYGWPKITYGINYSGTTITKNKSLPDMEQPLYYWLPSIAPSSFEYISSEVYPNWKGSLLAGALVFKYIERIGLNEKNKVISRSKIAEGLGRPRDVKQGKDGYIYVSIENKGVYKILPKK